MVTERTLSRSTAAALRLLGSEVAAGRRERRWTAAELAERAGVSLPTLRKVERGDPTVAIGTAFEIATLVGVQLWGGAAETARRLDESTRRGALLPERVRHTANGIDDDF